MGDRPLVHSGARPRRCKLFAARSPPSVDAIKGWRRFVPFRIDGPAVVLPMIHTIGSLFCRRSSSRWGDPAAICREWEARRNDWDPPTVTHQPWPSR